MQRAAIVGLFLYVAMPGCGFGKAREDAEQAVARHYDALANHREDAVLAGYDDKFFATVPRDEWAKRLATIESKVGQFQSFTVVGWNVNNKWGTGGGSYVMLNCKVVYSKYPADERMLLFRENSDGEFKILQHGVSSDAFVKE